MKKDNNMKFKMKIFLEAVYVNLLQFPMVLRLKT